MHEIKKPHFKSYENVYTILSYRKPVTVVFTECQDFNTL